MMNLALSGIGKWGKNYLKSSNELTSSRISYICSQHQETLDIFPSTYVKIQGIKKISTIGNIDGFIVATPSETHFNISRFLILNGFNVLIEKPLTTNLKDAVKLYKMWQKYKPIVLVGHLFIYNPAYEKLKHIVQDMGNIKTIYFKATDSPIRSDTSVLWDWGPHPISICLDLIKQPVVSVSAKTTLNQFISPFPHTAQIIIHFKNGTKANIKISWLGARKKRRLVVNSLSGKIVLDDTKHNKKLSVYRTNSTKAQFPTYDKTSPLTNQLNAFIKAVDSKIQPISDISLGVEVVRVISSVEQSALNNGQKIML